MKKNLVKYFTTAIVASSLGIFFLSFVFPAIPRLLSLSLSGFQSAHYWQLLTFSLFEPCPPFAMEVSYLTHLSLTLALFWKAASTIHERKGALHLFALIIGGALFAGLSGILFLTVTDHPFTAYASVMPLAFCLGIASLPLLRDSIYVLNFVVKWQWLIVAGLMWVLSSHLSSLSLFINLSAAIYGYLYAYLVWRQPPRIEINKKRYNLYRD